LQLQDALTNGYRRGRSPEFLTRGEIRGGEWLRSVGDAVFIVGGIGPLVDLAARMVANRNRPGTSPAHESVELLTRVR
jgi:nitric oxide reductase large subunit